MNSLLVMIGGALGALSRYGVGQWLAGNRWLSMPLGTLAVNLAGCLLLGLLTAVGERHLPLPCLSEPQSRQLLLLLTTGFCGAFTTFSTFSGETIKALESGLLWQSLAYATVSIVGGLLLFWCGRHTL